MITLPEIQRLAEQAQGDVQTGTPWLDAAYLASGSRFHWGHLNPYYLFLYLLGGLVPTRTKVELGVDRGIGWAMMAAGSPGRTIGVDKHQPEYRDLTLVTFPHAEFITGDTVEVGQRMDREGLRDVGLIFIDSTHTREHAKAEYLTWKPCFAGECIVVADDIIHADNNTDLPGWWKEDVEGEKILFPNVLHRPDNCIGVAIVRRPV